jgi:AbrB family looped-hinge helix DNA binding protein
MEALATTRLSSKGQVVIPEEIRARLGLEAGARFVVVGDRDVVILKVITPPSKGEFRTLLAKARRQARRAGMKRSDIEDALKKVRRRR